MKLYQSHKIIEAGQITGMASMPDSVVVSIDSGEKIKADESVFSRGMPRPGDYLVRYNALDDSVGEEYISWSPKDVFEAGNSEYLAGDESETTLEDPIPNKVTKEHLLSVIADVNYIRHEHSTLTICIITMENSFVVTGESACVDPGMFNEELGREIAYDNAFEKLWQLEGYLLLQKHHDVRYIDGGPKTTNEINKS